MYSRRQKLFVDIISWIGFVMLLFGAACFPAWAWWRDLKHLWLIPSGAVLVVGGIALIARAARISLGNALHEVGLIQAPVAQKGPEPRRRNIGG